MTHLNPRLDITEETNAILAALSAGVLTATTLRASLYRIAEAADELDELADMHSKPPVRMVLPRLSLSVVLGGRA